MFYCPYMIQMDNYRANYNIVVDTNARRLMLYRDGSLVKTYPVAVGKPSTPTPKGNFRIANTANHPGGPFGVYWLGLNVPGGDYGIHGTNNPSSIGKAVSHGCIRMQNMDILDLIKYVGVGTSVKII